MKTKFLLLILMTHLYSVTKPGPVSRGDTIGIVAPASYIEGAEQVVEALEERGYRVKLASNIQKKLSNFAGTDVERALGVMEMFEDPEVKAVWCLRGGYGSGRILPLLDYEVIGNNPKTFIGMSDITALHIALTQRCDLVTFLGPVASSLFLQEEPSEFAEGELWETIGGTQKEWYAGETLVSGFAEGRLTGGNLALLAAHVGTPWEIDTKGKILVLEDVDEYAYRIDRFLVQMEQAGLFDEVAGVILGTWEGCRASREGVWDVEEVLVNFFKEAPYPVLMHFPTGHIADQVTLPLNCLAELDSDAKRVTLVEHAITLEPLQIDRSSSL